MLSSSQYTMNIKELSEIYNIFDFPYTIESTTVTKEQLQHEFLTDYAMREICYETYEMWYPKFVHLWEKMVIKYDRLFDLQYAKTIEILKSSGSTNATTYLTSVVNSQIAKNIPTPATSVPSETDIPQGYQKSDGTNTGNGSTTNTKKETNDSDMAIINKYIREYRDLITMFINEFKPLFLSIY